MDRSLLSRARSFSAASHRKQGREENSRGREENEGARTETEAGNEGRRRTSSRSCGWTIRILGSRRWYGGMVQRLPAAPVVGGRTVARWEKRQTRRGDMENMVGVPMNHRWNGRTRRVVGWGRGRDKPGGSNHREWATRASRGLSAWWGTPTFPRHSLSLFLPFAPFLVLLNLSLSFFLSPSFEISSSHAVANRGTGVYRRNFIPTRARLSLRSPELMGSWKNLGRTLLASRTTLYISQYWPALPTCFLTLSTRIRTSINLPKYIFFIKK